MRPAHVRGDESQADESQGDEGSVASAVFSAVEDAMDLTIEEPRARREPTTVEIHGEVLQDDFAWMRDKESPEVIAYLEAENAYTAQGMKDTEEMQAKLYAEMLSHIKETDESVPYRYRGWWYRTRTEEGKQYPIYERMRAAEDGSLAATTAAEVLLDVNQLAEGQAFMAVGAMAVSPDGALLAYTTDNTGFRQYTLHVREIATGEERADTAERVGSVVWAEDGRTLFFTTEDEQTKRQDTLWRHRLGTSASEDVPVYREPDERFNLGIGRTRDGKFLVLEAGSHTTSEARVLDAEMADGQFRMIAERVEEQEYTVDHRDELFYIRVNDTGKNFRVVTAPVNAPWREEWKELIAEDKEAPLEDFDVFEKFCVCSRRRAGLTTLEVMRFKDSGELGETKEISFPEPAYTAAAHVNREFDTDNFRYSYQSLVAPASVYAYDVRTGGSTLLKEQEVPGGFDRTRYASERVWVRADDEVSVPVSLVYRRDRFVKDGKNALYVYGYGSYGYPLPIGFSATRLSLLDRGVVVAYAHIRGGGELGDQWHEAGKMMAKRNTFTDFVTAVDTLVRDGYGDRARVAIEGGSAGGLLMGAVVNLRTEAFRAVLSHVPFVDVVNTMLDASLPLTVAEYEEWGDPNEAEAFQYMRSYSPYDNLREGAYPAMLVKTSLNDSQVMYWEPAKYVAKLRGLKTNEAPLLLHINMDAGHGGASGRYDYLKEIAFDYAFLLRELGVGD